MITLSVITKRAVGIPVVNFCYLVQGSFNLYPMVKILVCPFKQKLLNSTLQRSFTKLPREINRLGVEVLTDRLISLKHTKIGSLCAPRSRAPNSNAAHLLW